MLSTFPREPEMGGPWNTAQTGKRSGAAKAGECGSSLVHETSVAPHTLPWLVSTVLRACPLPRSLRTSSSLPIARPSSLHILLPPLEFHLLKSGTTLKIQPKWVPLSPTEKNSCSIFSVTPSLCLSPAPHIQSRVSCYLCRHIVQVGQVAANWTQHGSHLV